MNTITATNNTPNKLHPHKLLMYIAIGSMTMMFAGWISAYMVRQAQGRWEHIHLPSAFYVSTIVILISSVTIFLAAKAHKNKKFGSYKLFLLASLILGIVFLISQYLGFTEMYNEMDIKLNGNNAAGEFTYVIPFVHGLHAVGGVIALIVVYISNVIKTKRNKYSNTGIQIAATYWHFVDALWLFIFLFLLYNQQA